MKSRLTLELEPFPAGQFIAVSRAKVRFKVNSLKIDEGSGESDEEGCHQEWQEILADGNFHNTNNFFNTLQEIRVGDRDLREFVSFGGISYWQFMPSYIWPHFFLAIQLVELISSVFEKTKPKIVEVCQLSDSNNAVWLGIVCAVAEQYGARIVLRNHQIAGWRHVVKVLKTYLKSKGIVYFIRHLCRCAFSMQYVLHRLLAVSNSAIKKRVVGRKLLCVTMGRRHWQPVPGDSSERRWDEQFSPLLSAFLEYGWKRFLFVDIQDVAQNELDIRSKTGDEDIEWRQFSSYLDFRLIGVIKAWLHFDAVWRKIRNDKNFLEDFKYRGVSLMPALAAHLNTALHESVLDCYDMLCIAGNILDKEKPAAAVLTYESGPWQRAVIIQAAIRNIPTLGLQHGMILDNHYDYVHARITIDPADGTMGFVVPRVTCVWGKVAKDSLCKKGYYPEPTVAITGNWRYDDIKRMKAAGRSSVEARLGYRLGSKKVVAIFTAGVQVGEFVKQCIHVLRQQRDDIVPLIRLHPSDDPQPIKKWLSEAGLSADTLYQGDLSDLFSISDLVICQFSTVVSEAMIMDKRVVLANFTKIDFSDIYEKSGACLYVTDPKALSESIDKLLYDVSVQSRLDAACKVFLKSCYYQLDGKSARRVVEALEGIM